VSDFPIRTDRTNPIGRQTRKLIDDAECAVACEGGDLIGFARQILAGRQQRDRYFDPVLFSNPAWDILLNLYVAAADDRAMSALDSCGASAMPESVVLRWLSYLKQDEMVIESANPRHPRQTLLRLSEQARLTIRSYLGSLVKLGLGPAHARMEIPPAQD
jgi:hypothetical protein